MKSQVKKVVQMAAVVCLVMLAGLLTGQTKVQAASEYTELFDGDYEAETTVKSGKYYFKCSGDDWTVYISDKKNSGYKATPIAYNAFSNGKQAYYVEDNTLYKYVFSTKKETKLKSLPLKDDSYWSLNTIYGSKLYLTKSSIEAWTLMTYTYNVNSGKLKKLKNNCSIIDRYGKYVITQGELRTDVSPFKVTLWKITSSGLKKIKVLTKNGQFAQFVDGKLYYTKYSDDTMGKVSLYRCNAGGSNKKLMASFETESEYDIVLIQAVTSKYCIVWMSDSTYKYTFKTGKLKKIS